MSDDRIQSILASVASLPRCHLSQDLTSDAVGARRRWGTLIVLTAAYALAQLDRNAINLLIPSIEADLHIGDTAAGLLTGFAFAALFSIASIPIGILADRIDRRWIIGIGMGAWTVFTALGAGARSFGALLGIRIGVGLGEAALAPSAYPILVDIFPARFAARAIGFYVAGATALSGIAIALAGRLFDLLGAGSVAGGIAPWRLVMIAVAFPGLLLVPLTATISPGLRHRSVPRKDKEGSAQTAQLAPAMLFAGSAAYYAVLYIVFSWTPSIFIRELGLTTGAAGGLLAGEQVLSGVAGALFGAWLADRAGPRARLRTALDLATIGLIGFPAGLVLLAAFHGLWIGALGALLGSLVGGFGMSVLPMAIQDSTAPEARSRATALFMLAINLFGTGLGPLAAGMLSDKLGPNHLSIAAAIAASAFAAIGITMFRLLRAARTSRGFDEMTSGL
jgi:MFS family permease